MKSAIAIPVVLVLCSAQVSPEDPEVLKTPEATPRVSCFSVAAELERTSAKFAPRGITIAVMGDNESHTMQWVARMNGTPDEKGMAKEAWSTATTFQGVMQDWARHFAANAVRLTAEAVAASKVDPHFN